MSDRVRPIDVHAEPPRRGIGLIVAAVVILGGFGAFLAAGNLSISATSTTAGPQPTTTTSVRDVVIAGGGVGLGELVPGFQGQLRGVQTSESGESQGWTWASGEAEPRTFQLAGNAAGAWGPALRQVAAIADSSFGRSLYFGTPDDVREVFNSVESFAWSDAELGSLAWLTAPQPDGATELWRSLPEFTVGGSRTFSASLVARLDFDGRLVGYGPWGFAVATISPSESRPLQLTTLDADGGLIATATFAYVADLNGDRLLVVTEPEGANPHLAITDLALSATAPVGPDFAFGATLSPNKEWFAATSIEASGASLFIGSTDPESDGSRIIPLGVDVALPEAWTSDGRWILLRGSPDAPALSDGTQLIFVDTRTDDIHVVTTPDAVSNLSIEATGDAGPVTFWWVDG